MSYSYLGLCTCGKIQFFKSCILTVIPTKLILDMCLYILSSITELLYVKFSIKKVAFGGSLAAAAAFLLKTVSSLKSNCMKAVDITAWVIRKDLGS